MLRSLLFKLTALCIGSAFVLTAFAAKTEGEGKASKSAGEEKSPADPFADPAWVKASTRPTRPTSRPSTRPVKGVDHVVIISVDGLRPDLLLRGDAPNIKELFHTGAYTFWARTTPNSITLPSHTSMLTGVSPRKHGIEWNRDLPLSRPVYPVTPTLFYFAKRYGYTTGMAAGKSKFDTLAIPGTLDSLSLPEKSTGKDADVARAAARIITSQKPDLMFVHLPGVDNAGHKYGWGTSEQMEAINQADHAVGTVLEALVEAKLDTQTVLIVTADHGGTGKGHGPDDPRSRHIPWIAHGPGVRKDLDLTTITDLEVKTEDTFATACWLLGINIDLRAVEGRPVTDAFKSTKPVELLKEVPAEPLKHAKADDKE